MNEAYKGKENKKVKKKEEIDSEDIGKEIVYSAENEISNLETYQTFQKGEDVGQELNWKQTYVLLVHIS